MYQLLRSQCLLCDPPRCEEPFNCVWLTTARLLAPLCAVQVLGRQLVQYAKHISIRTINVVRRDEHIDELKALG